MRNDLTAARLRELLHYDPETGVFTRVTSNPATNGRPVGWLDGEGHRYLRVGGVIYAAHRLAWLFSYGEWPRDVIDHVNGEKDDNRLPNLRDVDMYINMQNIRRARIDSSTGILGVSQYKKRFRADIKVNGKRKYLGNFITPELAHAAYVAAKRLYHPGCTI
jgi:hypothetical protein